MKQFSTSKAYSAVALSVGALVLVGTNALAQGPTTSVKPGPEILYRLPATSPQLENVGVWKADPILVSGATAYRLGEFLYQDYLYDDRGAGGRATYPSDKAKYAGNAADFVELRLKPLANATAIRVTFNSMINPTLVGTTIALGNSAAPVELPFEAHARMPAQVFVTVHGSVANVIDAVSGKEITGGATVSVDIPRRQVEIRVPYAVFDPRGKTVRVGGATGLWDVADNRYLAPTEATGGRGGQGGPPGAGGGRRGAAAGVGAEAAAAQGTPPAQAPAAPTQPRAVFLNVAFRTREPNNTTQAGSFWKDTQQAAALLTGDLSAFYADVDFKKLAAGTTDESRIPTTGYIDRILVSHFESAQGRGNPGSLGEECANTCIPEYAGRLQPYEIYVPQKKPPANGYGLTLDIHSAGANYNRWIGTNRQVEFGERGTGSIVATPEGRGEGTWYYGQAAADVFEVWADIARRYKIDPNFVDISGVSMGGYASWKLGAQYPDLFAAGALDIPCPIAGTGYDGTNAPGGVNSLIYPLIPSFRHVPVMVWTGELDTTCGFKPPKGQVDIMGEYASLGYRYTWFTFLNMPHATSNRFPNWQPFADFLDMKKRTNLNPAHVDFVVNTTMNEPQYGLVADHAYWLSSVTVRDPNASPIGTVDVVSHGIPDGDPLPTPKANGTGIFQSDDPSFSWPNYKSEEMEWGSALTVPTANVVDIKVRNISAITIDPVRARISCNAKVNLDSDGPTSVILMGCKK